MQLFMRALCCDDTTEQGADEIYIIVMGQCTDGRQIVLRIPSPTDHWNMSDDDDDGNDNPSGDSHCVTNKILFSESIDNGQAWSLYVMVMEEDNGFDFNKLQQGIAAVLLKSGDPYAAAAGAILGALSFIGINISNSDDTPGQFAVKIAKDDKGYVTAQWQPKLGIKDADNNADPADRNNPLKRELRMQNDSSNFVGWFEIKP